VFAATAWLALLCMWIGAVATDLIVDQRAGEPRAANQLSATNL